jgi:hypothetical protein
MGRKSNTKLQKQLLKKLKHKKVKKLFKTSMRVNNTKIEVKRDVEYRIYKTLNGTKVYKCPYCLTNIPVGTDSYTIIENNNILGDDFAIDNRRHWHIDCWGNYR